MARNARTVRDPAGQWSDWIELFNPGQEPFDLTGMSVHVRPNQADRWVFPAGSVLGPGEHLLLWCSDATAASTVYSVNMNVGSPLRGEGGGIDLFNPAGQLVDTVEYGFQIEDQSIGQSESGWGLLAVPTPGSMNSGLAELGDWTGIRFNEWLAASATDPDWFELFNASLLPASLSGLYLTDDPAIAMQTKHAIGPLTFIPAGGFVRWIADGQPQAGPDHVNFSLDARGELLRLNTNTLHAVDVLYFGPQISGVTEGRLPDGGEARVRFPHSATPGASNYLPLPEVVIHEVLTHTDPPLEDAIEVRNLGANAIDLGGWWLSGGDTARYRIPAATVLPAQGYHVFYEHQFNATPGKPGSFALNSAYGDRVALEETDATGQLTGRRATATFGAAANGISFGRVPTSMGVDHVPTIERSFGVDAPATLAEFRQGRGALNTAPRIGPLVIQEIMYHPPVKAEQEPELEFVELHNFSATEVALYDPAHATNTFRLEGSVQYAFPPGRWLAAGGIVLVVGFDPAAEPELANTFRQRYSVPPEVPLLGPYRGALKNDAGQVELRVPDPPQGPWQPDAGYVPYLVVDRVEYRDGSPWPAAADGDGFSLQRRAPHLYGNEPLHWVASTPSAGRALADPSETDHDRDGLPDAWEAAYGLDPLEPADAAWDGDGDGQSNLAEYLAGTDPEDPRDVLELRYEVDEWSQLLLFRAQPGRSYSVQYSEDLAWGVWLPVLTLEPADTLREIVVDTAEPPLARQRWYRVVMPAQP
jgi:hypothetical protein